MNCFTITRGWGGELHFVEPSGGTYMLTFSCTNTSYRKGFEVSARVAEVARGHGGPLQKSLDSNETFKPYHMLFCRELGFVAIYALFGVLWAKKVPFWVKNSVSWARSALLHGIYCIFH